MRERVTAALESLVDDNDPSSAILILRAALAEPQQKREPLTDEAILTTIHRASITVYNSTGDEQLLRVGRQIERAHGIGGSDE